MHIDLGPKREWGGRFAPRPAFAVEIPPARERLTESRTIRGCGAAGVAVFAEAAPAKAQDAILPLVRTSTASGGSSSPRRPLQNSCHRYPPATPATLT